MSRGDGVKLWTGNELSASPLLDYNSSNRSQGNGRMIGW